MEAESLFDAIARAVVEGGAGCWARIWWYDSTSYADVYAGDQHWRVKLSTVSQLRSRKEHSKDASVVRSPDKTVN